MKNPLETKVGCPVWVENDDSGVVYAGVVCGWGSNEKGGDVLHFQTTDPALSLMSVGLRYADESFFERPLGPIAVNIVRLKHQMESGTTVVRDDFEPWGRGSLYWAEPTPRQGP